MKTILFFVSAMIIFFVFAPITYSVFGATLKFDPETVATSSGKTFTVKVNITAGVDKIKSADAWIIYDPKILEPQTVEDGTFFNQVFSELSTSGKASVTGLQDDPTKPVTGTGTIATITFKALTNGTDSLTFDCTDGSTEGSMILKADDDAETNIIECSKNRTSAITVGSGADITPTIAIEPTDVQTPSTLPKSGAFENVIKFAVPGMILLLIGGAARLLL